MQFNSYEFIIYFLPICLVVYYLANKVSETVGKMILITSSIIFYSLGRINMLIYLGVSVLTNYIFAYVIQKTGVKNKWVKALPILINISLLLYFKYLNFAIENMNLLFGFEWKLREIILPLGISFFTFQQIAYLVAIEREEIGSNIIDYLTYILYFPKLIMGPIVDPADFYLQINDSTKKKANVTNIVIGIKLLSYGLVKKVLLADTFSRAVAWVHDNLNEATAMDCMLLALFYTFEIYFDFSGYSDMAIGISTMFNIDLPMNFDSPYKAISIRDFWKKWHISLTKFLTKYIYIPLGGSRKGVVFTYVNVMIVFLISGLWHGANWTFILWGLLHGLFSCCDRLFDKLEEKVFMPVRWLCSFGVISVLWLLFGSSTVGEWKSVLYKILHMKDTSVSEGLIAAFYLPENQFIYDVLHLDYLPTDIRGFNMLVFILIACLICFVPENNYRNREKLNIFSMLLASLAFVWGILCLGTETTFVYYWF
ncbi:MBOAT family acyltransferase [Butyrivibrio hungatei]|uniref:MBOAT family acyltransferase n=1 Tax=Butyrivibrio hungatei TaxID=185008 RepID=A0A1D9NYY7_9FIRM|nr:MBOAT family acyltransferase [Butyrivibrio hungatei]